MTCANAAELDGTGASRSGLTSTVLFPGVPSDSGGTGSRIVFREPPPSLPARFRDLDGAVHRVQRGSGARPEQDERGSQVPVPSVLRSTVPQGARRAHGLHHFDRVRGRALDVGGPSARDPRSVRGSAAMRRAKWRRVDLLLSQGQSDGVSPVRREELWSEAALLEVLESRSRPRKQEEPRVVVLRRSC